MNNFTHPEYHKQEEMWNVDVTIRIYIRSKAIVIAAKCRTATNSKTFLKNIAV